MEKNGRTEGGETAAEETNNQNLEDVAGEVVSIIKSNWETVVARVDENGVRTAEIVPLSRNSVKIRPQKKDQSEDFPPATPARITPSRSKPANRDYKTLYVFSDAQMGYRRVLDHETGRDELLPLHDERALRIGRMICHDLQPDTIVNLGDNVDLAEFSHFQPDSDHFQRTLGPALQRAHDYYAELRADNPDARIVEVDSNHNDRLQKFVKKNMPQVYNVKQASADREDYPVMSYPYLANLRHLGVDWVGGYGAAEFEYADDLVFRHGTIARPKGGATAAKLSEENPEVNVVQGHAHRMESCTRTMRDGKYLTALVVGAACKTTGEVPGFHTAVDECGQPVRYQENWQQGVLAIYDYGDGHYQFDQIPINNGRAFYKGKEYTAENSNDTKPTSQASAA
jgi:hypothetical protein